MPRKEENERRRYECVAGQGTAARLVLPGQTGVAITVNDISRGGVALAYQATLPVGTEVRLELAGLTRL